MVPNSVAGSATSHRTLGAVTLDSAWTGRPNSRLSESRERAALGGWFAVGGLALVVAMGVAVYVSTQVRELDAMRAATLSLSRELERESKALEARYAMLTSDERIERIAREQLHMVRPEPSQRRPIR